MNEITQAEQYLLDQISRGTTEAWGQLVERYEGRLLAFALARLRQRADAEDAVQDTFIAFLKGIDRFKRQSTLETYLFSILRRKIIDTYRRQDTAVSLIQDIYADDAFKNITAPNATASWYVSRDEQGQLQEKALLTALSKMIGQLKEKLNFRDLQIIELLFYSQLSNKQVAETLDLRENHVALIKHRCLKQVQNHLGQTDHSTDPLLPHAENCLRDLWQSQRLSCPKRSTIGSFFLKTLEPQWQDYVAFHLNKLGCHFCRANLDDLEQQSMATNEQRTFRRRILESTVGFLHK